MEFMGLNEIREQFLAFFEGKGHLRLPSFPLIPQGDNSLLLINSGMAPMKPYFSGELTPPHKRVATCQKCIRTPDIENVGKTSRHGTFFEMLGHFSFGDYFKREAITWTWEFLTEVMKIPSELLYATVYLDDDEAEALWLSETGIDPTHVSRLGKDDNFWEIGSGPCGPSSEIFFDRGAANGCSKPGCAPGCDCDRFVELGNNVFTQFSNDGNGNYTPLKQKNIDYGGGLERLACFMQGVSNLFEVDTIRNVLNHAARIAGVEYKANAKNDVSLRIITDHIRSTTMLVSDGVLPSNEGRGYVLRRLLRRAARHGKLLGITRPFLVELAETVIGESGGAYPELESKREYILKVIANEEERFNLTIDSGLRQLTALVETMKADGTTALTGAEAFKLYDTSGFPVDLTLEILEENGLTLDKEEFDRLMLEQRTRARAAREALGDAAWSSDDFGLDKDVTTEFVGYETTECEAVVLAVVSDGDSVSLILDRTPFYAESGGQVADTGVISSAGGSVSVTGVRRLKDGKVVHTGVISGELAASERVSASVDAPRRRAIMRAHSATHLLQKALRNRLGTHIEQAGSYVEPDRLRFDFTHFSALSDEDIVAIADEVNEQILADLPVDIRVMPIADAKALGAMALFGEKYGDTVRVVTMGDYSIELCGGTHLSGTAKIGAFRLTSESSVAAGVRRIEGIVGHAVTAELERLNALVLNVADAFKTAPATLMERIEAHINETRTLHRELDKMNAQKAAGGVDALLAQADIVNGVKVVAADLGEADVAALRQTGDILKDRDAGVAAVLAATSGSKLSFLAVCGKDAIAAGVRAGDLVAAVCKIAGGSGGGKPDSAMGGGKDASMKAEALSAVSGIVAEKLKK